MSLASIFRSGRPAFIPYVMAGDPDVETTRAIMAALSRAGAAAIELGIPYGDPLADGATIAAAGTRALANGTRIADALALVRDSRSVGGPAIVLFTYFNPVYQYGLDAFARDAARAGASGVLVPDIALEESDELRATLTKHGLEMPLMVAPSTPRERARRIAAASGGFVYVVSRLGVTGAGSAPDFSPLHDQVAMLRDVTQKPLAVGFGVSTAAHVVQVAPLVDGVIVGSALIDAYRGMRGQEAANAVEQFVANLFA
jgi:tryptophan synthase alpha chain